MTAGDPTSGYHDCPDGYYCPNGTGLDWMPCPRGTYSQQTNLYRVRMTAFGKGGVEGVIMTVLMTQIGCHVLRLGLPFP